MDVSSGVHLAFLGDGHNYHIEKWLPALVDQGLRVTLVTYHEPRQSLRGVDVVLLRPPFAKFRGRISILDFWGSSRPLRNILKQLRPDVLMASYAIHYGWLGARSGFDPFVLQTWTLDVSEHAATGWRSWIHGPVVRRTLRRAQLVTTDGVAMAEYVKKNYPEVATRVESVTWGIQLDEFAGYPERGVSARQRLGIADDTPVIVCGRGVDDVYRPATVLQAIRQVCERRGDVLIFVLTLGQERKAGVAEMLDAVQRLPQVRVYDRFLNRSEMADLWAAADVMVSVPETDGISESILEGMYMGAVPVVSDIPSNRALLTEGKQAYFVDGSSADELARMLVHVVELLPGLRDTVVPLNRTWVAENASVEATAAALTARITALHQTSKQMRSVRSNATT